MWGLVAEILANPAFVGSLYLAIVGAVVTTLVLITRQLLDLFTRMFVVSATVTNQDEPYEWLLVWLSKQPSTLSSRSLTLKMKKNVGAESMMSRQSAASAKDVQLLPGSGVHVVKFQNRYIWMSMSIGKAMTSGWESKPFQLESLNMSTYGRSTKIFTDLFEAARQVYEAQDQSKTKIYTLAEGGYRWICASVKDARPLDSVILDSDIADNIISDVTEFFQSEDWYVDRGIPYRRGYLLYGPPGCGKTSFITALAGKLNLSICVLNLSCPSLDDQALNMRLHETPEKSIILLEDVDVVFVARNASAENHLNITFSGLLNALDGVASQERRLLFMTTNHIAKLDAALIRPGRADVHIKFDYASPSQIRGLFLKFFHDEQAAHAFAQKCAGGNVPMAGLQGYLLERKDNMQRVLDEVPALLAAQRSETATKSMHAVEWLYRLGLEQYIPAFIRAKFITVEDFKDEISGQFSEMGITIPGHQQRILGMLSGRQDIKEQFEFASSSQAEALFMAAFPFAGEEQAQEFGQAVPSFTLSIAQIMKHCSAHASDPDTAIATVPQLVEKTNRARRRDPFVEIAVSLTQRSDAVAGEAGLSTASVLEKLALSTYAAEFTQRGLHTIAQLREASGWEDAIHDTAKAALFTSWLKGETDALQAAQVVTSADDITAIFTQLFPQASTDTAAAFVRAATAHKFTKAQLQALCACAKFTNDIGMREVDVTGTRAVALAQSGGQQWDAPVSDLYTVCHRLAIEKVAAKLAKDGIFHLSDLRDEEGKLRPDPQLNDIGISTVLHQRLLNGLLKRHEFALAAYSAVRTLAVAEKLVHLSFPRASAAQITELARRVPLGKCSQAQVAAFCGKHVSADAADDGISGAIGAAAQLETLSVLSPFQQQNANIVELANSAEETKSADSLSGWLASKDLSGCLAALETAGFNSVASLKKLSEEDCTAIGLSDEQVVKKLLAAIKTATATPSGDDDDE